jgi:hypothetical protein
LALQENLYLIRTDDIHRQAMLGDDDSLGQEAAEKVVEDLKFEIRIGPSEHSFEKAGCGLGLYGSHQPIAC